MPESDIFSKAIAWLMILTPATVGVGALLSLLDGRPSHPIAIVTTVFFGSLALIKTYCDAFKIDRPFVSRSFRQLIVGVLIIFFGMSLAGWRAWQKPESLPDHGFRVSFRTSYINMSRDPNASYYFGYLMIIGNAQMLAPVAVMSYVEIESYYKRPVAISSYSMSITTPSCGVTSLSDLSPGTGAYVYVMPPGPSSFGSVIDSKESLERQLENPIQPNVPIRGQFYFGTKVDCPVHVGDRIKLQLDLQDSFGNQESYSSPDLTVSAGPDSWGSSVSTPNVAGYNLDSDLLNPSELTRHNAFGDEKLWASEGMMFGAQAIVRQRSNHPRVTFPDGAYIGLRP